ncbi:hypothetical protein DPX16_23455 [Anabarilius grahami]|uniref:Retrotransposon gag domain-containing protein n=1 Tax=Anabarilius grahami TaxID=495550 RepID=A0A3N0XXS6_ANAGA|nr:hypothetical protein DPX16_23455 [Anabarilius grahami]
MLAINASGDSWTTARRRAVLLHCLGTEGQRMFYTLQNTGTTYDEAMSSLEAHFIPKVNVVVARHQFRQRAQCADETIAQYTTALRGLAVDCAYGTVEDEMIRDQLIKKAYATTVREKLLLDQPASLEAAVTVACQIEQALHNVNLLRDTAPVNVATPHATTSVSPSELLHNRKMRTKVDILPVREKRDKCAGVRETVKERQEKSKEYTDRKRRAKPVSFKVKEQVRIRKPDHVPKGSPKYTLPLSIREKIGPSSFLLSDGKKWNGLRLTKFTTQIEKTAQGSNLATQNCPVTLRRSERCVKPPMWMKDFIKQ